MLCITNVRSSAAMKAATQVKAQNAGKSAPIVQIAASPSQGEVQIAIAAIQPVNQTIPAIRQNTQATLALLSS
jgi:hypothetical protein